MRDIDEIVSDFEYLDTWDDRYRFVMELGRELPPLADDELTDHNKVRGCLAQVWLVSKKDNASPPNLYFKGYSDSDIVRGLIYISIAYFSGHTAEQIRSANIEGLFDQLKLRENLTSQRSNGLRSMIERIKKDARAAMEAA